MQRVSIGENFVRQPAWKIAVGVPLIYLPILLTLPFAVICVLVVKTHLTLMGAKGLRTYWSFVPTWVSHRYHYRDQITYDTGAKWHNFRAYRWYWIFNCKIYCPLSLAVFRYLAYLVMVVENWWCPFEHEKKCEYAEGAIDKSYWHIHSEEASKLHPDDHENPIWNDDAK